MCAHVTTTTITTKQTYLQHIWRNNRQLTNGKCNDRTAAAAAINANTAVRAHALPQPWPRQLDYLSWFYCFAFACSCIYITALGTARFWCLQVQAQTQAVSSVQLAKRDHKEGDGRNTPNRLE